MRNTFIKTNAVLQECVDHIQNCSLQGSPIESYLVEHLLVIFCAEVQQEVYKSIESYASTLGDEKLQYFVKNANRRLFRSIKKSEIAGLLMNFGEATKEHFNSKIQDSDVTYYSIVVDARHDVAHKTGSMVTINDFIKARDSAELIIQAIDESLQLKNTRELG